MRRGRARARSGRWLGPVLAIACGLLVAGRSASSVAAADATLTFAVGAMDCTHDGADRQLCPPAPTVTVATDGVLQVEFVASAGHCSSVISRLIVDGIDRFTSEPLEPGGTTGVKDFGPVAPGAHTVGVQALGVVGGCNGGAIGSWLGELRVTASGPLASQGPVVLVAPSGGLFPSAGATATPASATPLPAFATESPRAPADGPAATTILWIVLGGLLLLVLLVFLVARRGRRKPRAESPPR